jgi:hypothetical protein
MYIFCLWGHALNPSTPGIMRWCWIFSRTHPSNVSTPQPRTQALTSATCAVSEWFITCVLHEVSIKWVFKFEFLKLQIFKNKRFVDKKKT